MHFPLFELAKVLSFGAKKDHCQGVNSVKILKSAWCEDGEKTQLALFLSNGYLVLRYSINHARPTLRQVQWPRKDSIHAMCYDGRGTWLVCVTKKCNIYIIPALAMMDLNMQIDAIWNLNDTTVINLRKKSETPTSIVWWQMLVGNYIAIIGTRLGKIIFVDLITEDVVHEIEIKGSICHLELVRDDSQSMTHLLITCKSGHHWRLLLERKDTDHLWHRDSELSNLGYTAIDSSYLPITCILTKYSDAPEESKNEDDFMPTCFYSFPLSVRLQPQFARGRHFVTAYDRVKKTFEVYDSSLEHTPLFIYRVPSQTEDVILSSKLLLCSMKTKDVEAVQLVIISNQMAETSTEQMQNFNRDAVVQEFELQNCNVVSLHKRSFPYYLFEQLVENQNTAATDGDQLQITRHTVLDGCIIVTETEVYECRPRISPERLFLNLCLTQTDFSRTEQLGIMLGLDIHGLYEEAANHKMENGDFSSAMRLYKLSKCPHSKRVAIMAQHGHLQEVMTYLQQIFQNTGLDLSTAESKVLADLALHGYVYMIESKLGGFGMKQAFGDFLLKNFSYDEEEAIQLLLDHCMVEQLFELAKARGTGMMISVMKALIDRGFMCLSKQHVESLIEKRMAMALVRIGSGCFLHCMDPDGLVHFITKQPQLAADFISSFSDCLYLYDETILLNLAKAFDPSNSLVQMYLHKAEFRQNMRSLSISSVSSLSSVMSEDVLQTNGESWKVKATNLVEFFIHVVLELHKRRGFCPLNPEFFQNRNLQIEESASRKGKTYSHLVAPVILGCGYSHSALIRNGELFTWGNTMNGRLGHGNIAPDHVMYPPCMVETLYMLKIKVRSVSCGAKHTLALTQQGVFGWGSSQYGQVGIGDDACRSQPMQIETLSNIPVISVVCGQYHSIALTADSRVYSWGWGVHGQLGHGSIEDTFVPTKVEGLVELNITQVQAAYAHSLVLTAKGNVFGFGNNIFGQLGQGKIPKLTLPKRLEALAEPVTMISSKYFCSYALTSSNQLYKWGCSPLYMRQNFHLAAANQTKFDPDAHLFPSLVDLEDVEGKIVQMSAGSMHVAILTDDGKVYCWGKNFDGQLGVGTTREYNTPILVKSLNERVIKSVNCGSSHTLVMDNDGVVFSFGRNEFCQLGISDHYGMDCLRTLHDPGSQFNPIHLKWVPSPRAHGTSENTADDIWLLDGNIEGEEIGAVGNLPDLSTLTTPPYTVHVLTALTQHLPEYCSLTWLSRRCSEDELWGIVADIYEVQQLYVQSLWFRLKEIWIYHEKFEDKKHLLNKVRELLYKYFDQIEAAASKDQTIHDVLESLLSQVFAMWVDLDLPFSDLEEILESYLDLMAFPLSQIITGSANSCNGTNRDIMKLLSVKFTVSIISLVIKFLENGKLTKKQIEKLNNGVIKTPFVGRPKDLTHQQKLWQEILQNLHQDIDKMTHVNITHMDAKSLAEHDDIESDESKAVFFTCGHHFQLEQFVKEVVPRFSASFIGKLGSLQQSANLLTHFYTKGKKMPMACPKCVQDYIEQSVV